MQKCSSPAISKVTALYWYEVYLLDKRPTVPTLNTEIFLATYPWGEENPFRRYNCFGEASIDLQKVE